MLDWLEQEPIYKDAFGGCIYSVAFDAGTDIVEDASLVPEDGEENAEEIIAAQSAKSAFLIVHANGHEIWTTTGFDFAKEILLRGKSPTLFDL